MLHIKFHKGNRPSGSKGEYFLMLLTYQHGEHFDHVTVPNTYILFLPSSGRCK